MKKKVLEWGGDGKRVEVCKMESSVYEWIGLEVEERSLIERRKKVGDRTEPWGTPLLIQRGRSHYFVSLVGINGQYLVILTTHSSL